MRRKFRYFRNYIALFLTVLTVFSSCSLFACTTASATTVHDCESISYNKALYDKNAEVCQKIADGIENMEDQIYIGDYKVKNEVIPYIIKTVVRKHPEMFYVDTAKCMIGTDGTYAMVILPIYNADKATVEKQRKEFRDLANSIVNKYKNLPTEFQKATALHDEIILTSKYAENSSGYISAYETLVNHRGNCQGYSEAYAYLLSLMGIKSEIVESSSMYHIWTKVCIDGSYYNVDLTWDDPMPDKNGLVSHKYFLKSDAAISVESPNTNKYYGFDYAYFKATSTKYDKAPFHNYDSKFCFFGDKLYAVDNAYADEFGKSLVSYDLSTNKVSLVKGFDFKWSAGDNKFWRDGFSGLDQYDTMLYYNSPDAVYEYNTVTGNEIMLAGVNSIKECYGLRIIDKDIYVSLSSDPNTSGELKKVATARIMGDIDGDGILNVRDVTLLQKMIVMLSAFSDDSNFYADMNNDGKLTVLDVTAIQKKIAS